jgi:hypothetical protein
MQFVVTSIISVSRFEILLETPRFTLDWTSVEFGVCLSEEVQHKEACSIDGDMHKQEITINNVCNLFKTFDETQGQ